MYVRDIWVTITSSSHPGGEIDLFATCSSRRVHRLQSTVEPDETIMQITSEGPGYGSYTYGPWCNTRGDTAICILESCNLPV